MIEGHHRRGAPVRGFDGIEDNRVDTIPKGYALLCFALLLWGAVFAGYDLFFGWSSEAEYRAASTAAEAR